MSANHIEGVPCSKHCYLDTFHNMCLVVDVQLAHFGMHTLTALLSEGHVSLQRRIERLGVP